MLAKKGVLYMIDNYAESIKELRTKMTLSQIEFAQVLGVSFASVNRWETGKHEPTIKIKRKIKALMREYDVRDRVGGAL